MNDPYLIALSCVPGISAKRLLPLLQRFQTPERVWREAQEHDANEVSRDQAWGSVFSAARRVIRPERELERVLHLGATCIGIGDREYPPLLANIHEPPPFLFVRGTLTHYRAVAVVGTRRSIEYTERATREIVRALVAANITIVSGLAYGIDAEAHETAFNAGGRTVAVLGSGLNSIAPRGNEGLAEHIVQSGGALVSEFPLDMDAQPFQFPQRNRVISGMSQATVVVAAGRRSGALITAQLANEQGRDVFAVPGGMFTETSYGCNLLIRDGAGIVASPETLIEDLGLQTAQPRLIEYRLTEQELEVMSVLTREPIHFDSIAGTLGLDAGTLGALLTILETKGAVESHPGMRYTRCR